MTAATNLVKLGQGTLVLGGTSSNSYQGNTFLNEGTLTLDKQDVGQNEVQILEFGGTTGSGTVQLSFAGVNASNARRAHCR